MYRVLLG